MISMILPVRNCITETSNSLPILVKHLFNLGHPFEVILVDDNSMNPEKYLELAEANHCIYLRNDKNYGKGFSVGRGFAYARGSILIFMDGDFPFEMEVVNRMVEVFEDENNDVVIGDRSMQLSKYPIETNSIRRLGSSILSFLANHYITPGFSDTQCGIKGFRKSAADGIFPYSVIRGFSFDIEVLYIAIKKKFIIKKIPVQAKKQNSSNVRVLKHGLEMMINIIRIYIRRWRGHYQI